MKPDTRNALIAGAVIFIGFAALAYLMPTIMLAVGEWSTVAAAMLAVVFVGGFFLVFWLRGRSRGGGE